ncbi:MAG: hypothetical protein AVDCRST_MAG56-3201 [uncultured Cytophagales bacterium]|uniref:Outer membrane protein beta-barrel domain-containing protein n=1 Tax=uncultured Cytophagales bacterium TaxID=158755 RepID=A0A6J4J6H7_9SPHI|nr:MAG: hypothetical protein AVDCRST_MAG56-3201 [uncultured Cytophagales bacterium]
MHKFFLICTLAALGSIACPGQEKFKLSGKVTSTTGPAVEAGDVMLLRPGDSTVVKVTIIRAGQFDFNQVEKGAYVLKAACLGYLDAFASVQLDKDTEVALTMEESAVALQGVSVVGEKNVFSSKEGNLTMNVENTIFAETSNTVDLMTKLPGIQLTPDKQLVYAIGRAEVVIFLDNQRVTMNDLTSLSPRDIRDIEIVNNPSSKYDADGRVVILVRRKVNQNQGFKTDISETASIKRRYNNYLQVNTSVRRNRLELKGNVQYNHLKIWERNSHDFRIDRYDLRSNYAATSVENSPQFVLGGGVFYQLNDDDYISVNANARIRDVTYPNNANSVFSNGERQDNIITNTFNDNRRVYYSGNGNYSKKLKKLKGQLFFGAQYSGYAEDLATSIFNGFNGTPEVESAYNNQLFRINALSGKIDFEKALWKDAKWEMGVNVSKADAKAIADIRNYQPPASIFSTYDYDELIKAGYTQLSGKLSKISYTAGVRAEDARIIGGFRDSTDRLLDRRQLMLFPKANVDISLDTTKGITFNYAKSIRRPNFSSLNQIVVYLNPFTEFARNITLRPTITHDLSAGFRYKDKLLRVFYYWQQDPVYFGTEFDEARQVVTLKDRNYAREAGVNVSLTYPIKYKQWSSTNVMVANFSRITDPEATLNEPRPNVYLYSSNQFALPRNYSLLVTAWFVTKRYTGLYERNGLSSVDLGVSKTFFERLSCTLSFDNIFRGQNFVQTFDIDDVYSRGTYFEDVRALSLTFKYSLGAVKSAFKNVDTDMNIDRIK